MGATTYVQDADGYSPLDGSNGGIMLRGKVTMSNSYATGGDTIAGATVGLGMITKLETATASKTSDATHSYIFQPVYDSTAVNVTKVQAFWAAASGAPFIEVTNTTDLSAVV